MRRVRITIETVKVTVSGREPDGPSGEDQTEGSHGSPDDSAGTKPTPEEQRRQGVEGIDATGKLVRFRRPAR